MNYTEIKTLAYAYADREDTDSLDRYDDFLRIAESNINRKLKTLDSATQDVTAIVAPLAFISKPADFGGVRRIIYVDANSVKHTMKYVPEHVREDEFKIEAYRSLPSDIYYAQGTEDITFSHTFEDGEIRMSYYRKVPQLTSGSPTNWVGDDFPDAYVFGVRAEIAAFVKNMQSAADWEARMEKVISEIVAEDSERRWSGEPMQMRTQ